MFCGYSKRISLLKMKWVVKYFLGVAVILSEVEGSFSQNLIPNGDFEQHDKCLGLNTRVSRWTMPVGEYYHYLCDCFVPKAQYSGEEKNFPHLGKGFTGICLHGTDASEYMMIQLNQSLIANTEYYFSGYVLLGDEKRKDYLNFKQLEIGFSDKEYSVSEPSYIFLDPELLIPVSFAQKEKEWIFISGRFTSSGNESNMIIGNFLPATPLADELAEYMGLPEDEREPFLKKHKKLAAAMTEFNSEMQQESKPYRVRIYFDDLCLMPLADSAKGFCNYPITKISAPEIKAEVNKPIVIENIFFETGKSTLLPASFSSLGNLADWLKKNPSAEIQISGHTDNKGNEEENKKLSFDRAKSVKDYLASKNAMNKIEINGMGSSKPVASNDSEDGRSKNRRVEFTIIKQ